MIWFYRIGTCTPEVDGYALWQDVLAWFWAQVAIVALLSELQDYENSAMERSER